MDIPFGHLLIERGTIRDYSVLILIVMDIPFGHLKNQWYQWSALRS